MPSTGVICCTKAMVGWHDFLNILEERGEGDFRMEEHFDAVRGETEGNGSSTARATLVSETSLMPLSAVSLFTNCAAGDVGYSKAGFRFEVLAEIDQHRLAVAGLNLPDSSLIPGDLRSTWSDVVFGLSRSVRAKAPPLY